MVVFGFLCIITAGVLCCTILYYSRLVEGCHGKQTVGIHIAKRWNRIYSEAQ